MLTTNRKETFRRIFSYKFGCRKKTLSDFLASRSSPSKTVNTAPGNRLKHKLNASLNSTCAQPPPPPPGLLRGIFPPCQSRGWGICKFCTARGPGICQPPGHSRAFDTHPVAYQNITTQKVLLEKKQIGSSVKDRNKL